MNKSVLRSTFISAALTAAVVTSPAIAHHGFGLFQVDTVVHYEGTITGMDFVNPHSYLYFDRVDENGNTINMRCEMRAAILLRRSGWSKDMFEVGLPVSVDANPHRDDPSACYTENITIGDQETINRNDQFTIENPVDNSGRVWVIGNTKEIVRVQVSFQFLFSFSSFQVGYGQGGHIDHKKLPR